MENGTGSHGVDLDELDDERDTLLPPLSASALRCACLRERSSLLYCLYAAWL